MAEQHYKMWWKSARTSMLRTQPPPPLQLPGIQSVPIVGVIHGGIYGLNVFPIPLDTREKTCKIKCRKGLLWWVTTWAWNYSLWYRQTVEGICLKDKSEDLVQMTNWKVSEQSPNEMVYKLLKLWYSRISLSTGMEWKSFKIRTQKQRNLPRLVKTQKLIFISTRKPRNDKMMAEMQWTLKCLMHEKGRCLLRSTAHNFGNKFLICRQRVIHPSRSKCMCMPNVQTNNIILELVSIFIYSKMSLFLKFMAFLE